MKEILEILKQCSKENLQWIILELMTSDMISFAELAEIHVKHLEQLKEGKTEELMKLRSEVISLWCGTKKELPSKLVSMIQEGKDNGWVNLTQEQIDNSKWNR